MQKTLLTTTLAIIGSFVVGSSALAAPSVTYKKRLDVPTVPATVINQVKAMSWRYTTDKGTQYKPAFATFTKVAVKTPALVTEKDCSDVTYRIWAIGLDIAAMRKTNPDIVPYAYSYDSYYAEGQEIAKYVFEARTPKGVKWQIDPKVDAAYSKYLFVGCQGKDLVIENTYAGETSINSKGSLTEIRKIPFISFTNDNAWKAKPIEAPKSFSNYQRVTVDGILQSPGKLTVYGASNLADQIISGDSRVTTLEDGNGVQVHNLPRYRDLSAVSLGEKGTLNATFYRMKDGYAVYEAIRTYEGTAYKNVMTYYRIRNGEAQYSVVDSLPFANENYYDMYDKGLELIWRQNPGTKNYSYTRVLIHGLKTGHNLPTSVYDVNAKTIWETDSQAYLRYLITDKLTGKQQYWEATVNKQ